MDLTSRLEKGINNWKPLEKWILHNSRPLKKKGEVLNFSAHKLPEETLALNSHKESLLQKKRSTHFLFVNYLHHQSSAVFCGPDVLTTFSSCLKTDTCQRHVNGADVCEPYAFQLLLNSPETPKELRAESRTRC